MIFIIFLLFIVCVWLLNHLVECWKCRKVNLKYKLEIFGTAVFLFVFLVIVFILLTNQGGLNNVKF